MAGPNSPIDDQQLRDLIVDRIAAGWRTLDIARVCGVDRRTVLRWKKKPGIAEAVEDRRLDLIEALNGNLEAMAFNPETSEFVRLRATMELLKKLSPEHYDPRIRHQIWMDARDERLQEENARKAMEQAEVTDEEDPQEEVVLFHVVKELQERRRQAARLVALEADGSERGS